MKEVAAIFAIGPDNIIGIKDKMPWHSKQDFYHFKKVTNGYPCLFGATTFYGLPKYPLLNRLNVVLDNFQKEDITADNRGWVTCNSFECALLFCENYDKIFVCGGASIYKYALENNLINTIYLTKITSPSLQMNISKNLDEYVHFPIDLQAYLSKNWVRVPFNYSVDELPEEKTDIVVQFQKWIKL